MTSENKAKWLKIGKNNIWIREAYDPEFTEKSFHKCGSDEELLDKLQEGWTLGQAFHIGDLCFIEQIDGGSEWLTIKGDLAFESISFRSIVRQSGREAAQAIIDRIRKASPDQCRSLNY